MPTPHEYDRLSPQAREILCQCEGLRTVMYCDTGGQPTIGIGHLLTADERRSGNIQIAGQSIPWSAGLSESQCWSLLDQDLLGFVSAVRESVRVPLQPHQFDALVVFAFNIGQTAFRNSTLLRLLNAGHCDAVPAQLRRWVHDNGKRVAGLVNRRDKEIALWNGQAEVSLISPEARSVQPA